MSLRSTNSKYSHFLMLLLIASGVIRCILAFSVELGNDEVYYITYALFPDISHFDHPPMVGWFMQLFTFDLLFNTEGWIRMGAVISGTLSTLIIYKIGKEIGDEVTGWYSALLYTFSVYGFIITGIFMMPDSPQMLFWLLSIYLVLIAVNRSKIGPETKDNIGFNTNKFKLSSDYSEKQIVILIILAGLTTGLSLLSKYTSIFILTGMFLWFLSHRYWLKKWYVWIAAILAIGLFIPVVVWNSNNDFISFTFHSNRVEMTDRLLRFDSFFTELIGQIIYNNPVIFVLVIVSVIAYLGNNITTRNNGGRLLILISIPLILLFLSISLFRSTLPHWTGPAYVTLLPLAAQWIRQKTKAGITGITIPKSIAISAGFLILLISAALLQLNYNTFLNKGINPETGKRLGIKDITLDMYGWRQLEERFEGLYNYDLKNQVLDSNAVIISHRWFPAANLDYYVASKTGIKVITMARLERTHKYAWISETRGGYTTGMDAYFISSSYDFQDPNHLYNDYFTILEPDTIPIFRNDLLVKYYYVWRMKDLKKLPPADYLIK